MTLYYFVIFCVFTNVLVTKPLSVLVQVDSDGQACDGDDPWCYIAPGQNCTPADPDDPTWDYCTPPAEEERTHCTGAAALALSRRTTCGCRNCNRWP